MGRITITPHFQDYSINGAASTWAGLGANEAAAKAVVQQVCTNMSDGLRTLTSSDLQVTVYVGVNAYGTADTDTIGSSIPGAATNFPNLSFYNGSVAYSSFRNLYQAYASPNSFQQLAWAGLSSTNPLVGGGGGIVFNGLLGLANGIYSGSAGVTMSYIGFKSGSYPDLSQYGTGTSGVNLYSGIFHEITEYGCTRWGQPASSDSQLYPLDYYTYTAANTRFVTNTARYYSIDSGTTIIANLNTGAGDPFDWSGAQGTDSFTANVTAGAVSRSSAEPGTARDWQTMGLIFPLSSQGASWAGVPVNSVAPQITGNAPVTNTLSVSTVGTWSNSPTFSYQWTRDGSPIATATSSTYQTQAADISHAVSLSLTATGASSFLNSAATASNSITVTASAAPSFGCLALQVHG